MELDSLVTDLRGSLKHIRKAGVTRLYGLCMHGTRGQSHIQIQRVDRYVSDRTIRSSRGSSNNPETGSSVRHDFGDIGGGDECGRGDVGLLQGQI